jgi:hypothetical protein
MQMPPFKMYLRHGTKALPHIYNITHEAKICKGNFLRFGEKFGVGKYDRKRIKIL